MSDFGKRGRLGLGKFFVIHFLCWALLVETGPAVAMQRGPGHKQEWKRLESFSGLTRPSFSMPADVATSTLVEQPSEVRISEPRRPWRIQPVASRIPVRKAASARISASSASEPLTENSPAAPATETAVDTSATPSLAQVPQEPPTPPGMSMGLSLAASGRVLTGSSESPGIVPGWNLISLPKQPADPSPGAAFASLAGHFTRIFAYDACDAADPWKLYDPANPGASDLAVDIESGLWIESTATAPLPDDGSAPAVTTIHLCPGWNLIGFPADEPRAIEAVLAPIAGKYARVFGFDPTDVADPWEIHDVAVPAWANDLKLLRPGRGYWILATAETDLTIQREQAPLVVALTAPADLGVVTAPTDVIGTVTGDSLSDWTLSYRAEGEETWTPVGSGTGAVVDGTLGVFDPTLLLNGPYEIELAGTDAQGETTIVQVDVNVEGQMKIGLFTLTFSDLEVALAGLPIEILRTYDSRDKQRGDFGIGWRLELRQGSYKNNRKPGDGWKFDQRFLPCDAIGETRGHQTTIRLSDREIYRFKLSLFQGVPTQGGCFARAHFDFVDGPIPGATLEILGSDQVLYQNGANEVVDPGSLEIYEPRRVRLTTRDGRTFNLDLFEGVTRVEDLNGNALSITPEGITHTSGRSVIFERDGEGRITRITDPEGEGLVYAYDVAGDLMEVRDREDHPTTFTYDSRHLLLDIEDARGIKAVRNEYDASGRVVKHIDAFGKEIGYARDIAARQEIVTDRLGASRLLEYDERGNIVREVDALQNETLRTFDVDDRLLTETDPLGNATRYAYDAAGNLVRHTDPLGNETVYTHNARGEVLTTRDPRGKVTTNEYDEQGNLLRVRDAAGGETVYTYDEQGNVLTETGPEGGTIRSAYDVFGNQLGQVDALGHETAYTSDGNGNRLSEVTTRTRSDGTRETLTTRFSYDKLGNLIQTVHPDSSITRTVYDALGQVVETIDALERKTVYRYDALGRQVETTFPDGTSEKRGYDAEGRLVTVEDRGGRITTHTYDRLGRPVRIDHPDGTFTESSYDAAGRLASVTDARRNTTTYVYDKAGRRTQILDPLGGRIDFEYDQAGNQIAITDPNRARASFEFDDLNRRVRTIHPDGSELRVEYDSLGQAVSETDPAQRTTRFEHDLLGRLVKVTDALGQETLYFYDELGNRTAQTDANGHVTRFEVDVPGRMTRRILPDGSVEEMSYDLAGRLASRKDFEGRVTSYQYDRADRLTQRSHAGGTVTFAYTVSGRRQRVTDGRGATTYAYDQRDRLTELVYPDGRKLTYAYDANGNRLELTAHVAGQVLTTSFTYDALNRLDQVTDPRGRTYDHGYDANGNRTALLYPNGIETAWSYDALNRLTELKSRRTGVGEVIQAYAYTLGAAGHRTRIDEHDGASRVYAYDALYRLIGETVSGGSGAAYAKAFTYDRVGNRLRQTHTDASGVRTTDSSYDQRDRILTEGDGTYSWNANGQMTEKSGQAVYAWDLEERLRTVTKADGTVVTHAYDADGNRVRTEVTPPNGPPTVTESLVDPSGPLSHVVAETDASGALTAYYVRGDDLLAVLRPTGDRFYHADGLGSVRALTDEAGQVTDRYTFTAFGELLAHQGSDPNAYLFAGEPLDPNSGFYYLRARWMDPAAGRFASMDPFGGFPYEPPSLHKYLYAEVDPVNLIDPSGLVSVSGSLSEVILALRIQAGLFIVGAQIGTRTLVSAVRDLRGIDWTIRILRAAQFRYGPAIMASADEAIAASRRSIDLVLQRSDSVIRVFIEAKNWRWDLLARDPRKVAGMLGQLENQLQGYSAHGMQVLYAFASNPATTEKGMALRARVVDLISKYGYTTSHDVRQLLEYLDDHLR
jgi:RHS repeat-associated protein